MTRPIGLVKCLLCTALIINTSCAYCYTILERDNFIADFKFGLGSVGVKMTPIPDSIKGDMSFGSGEALMSASIAKEVEVLKFKLEWESISRYEGGSGMPPIIKDSVIENASSYVHLIFKPSIALFDNPYFFLDIGPSINYITNEQQLRALNINTSVITEYVTHSTNNFGAGINSSLDISYPLAKRSGHAVPLFISCNYDLIFSYKPINKIGFNFGVREEGARKGLKVKGWDFFFFYNMMNISDFRYKLVGIGAALFF